MESNTNTWGGVRAGAGRPKGSKNIGLEQPRKQRQLRAHDDEWQMINAFAKYVKKSEAVSKAELYEMIKDYTALAEDCKRNLKRIQENPLPDGAEYKDTFEKYLKHNTRMINFLVEYLKKFS